MDFFNKDYEIPQISKYMKFEEGENIFRILGSFINETAVMGTVYWKTADKGRMPVRLKPNVAVPASELELNPKTGEIEIPKHFWAFPVYNYRSKSIQILEITQKSIMNAIKSLAENKKWGNPNEYDLVIVKSVENGKTSYSTTPDPKEPLDKGVVQLYKDMFINLNALYSGEDPFAVSVNPDEIPDSI